MNTAISSTAPISTKITHIVRLLAALILAGAAGCTSLVDTAPDTPQAKPCPVCPAVPPKPAAEAARFEEVAFSAVPGWTDGSMETSLRAFVAGCARPTVARAMGGACAAARSVAPGQERQFFESAFRPWRISAADGEASGLVTGYYEPLIDGSRTRTAKFRHPVFGVPDDLVVVDLASLHPDLAHQRLRGRLEGRRLVPYWSRAEIESRGESLGARVLAWVADPVELFFLQIQGTGQVKLADGGRLRLGYADQNGHPYRSLGRHLVDRGELKLEQASMQGIKAWAAANPGRMQEALNQNPSYVFFREADAAGGPAGALGVPLTAGHSIAIDPRHVPLGAPVFLDTTWPLSPKPLQRLVVAQDTGGAIRGAVRADFFWGTGDEAGALAGRMRQRGAMWLLWPAGEKPPGA